MQKLIITVLFAIIYISVSVNSFGQNVIASDIENFWNAHDKIVVEKDYETQIKLINDLYINKGTKGLKAIMQARRYTDKQYVDAINNYPKFWQSVRKNTYKAKSFAKEIENGVAKLKQIYPDLKPAKVYFTIGVFRTPGTTLDGMVLIGSELALSDENVDTSELPKNFAGLLPYFKSNPINDITFLNVHEFVHTQQKTAIGSELLTQTIREGIAEFITVKALQMKSPTPAITFGKENRPKLKDAFTKEMFSTSYYNWLWNNVDNQFKTRDLGYFVGYDLAEKYYENSFDKKNAIKELIELDLQNNIAVAEFVNSTKYFSKPIKKYRKKYEKNRPNIKKIVQFNNGSQNVNPSISKITIVFSEKMDTRFRGFNFGPLGEKNVLKITKFIGFSKDGKSLSFEVKLLPNKRYQMRLPAKFKDLDGVQIKPYLIDIKTSSQ